MHKWRFGGEWNVNWILVSSYTAFSSTKCADGLWNQKDGLILVNPLSIASSIQESKRQRSSSFTLVYINDLLIAYNLESFCSYVSYITTNQKRSLHISAKLFSVCDRPKK